jgi:hypothetical protein
LNRKTKKSIPKLLSRTQISTFLDQPVREISLTGFNQKFDRLSKRPGSSHIQSRQGKGLGLVNLNPNYSATYAIPQLKESLSTADQQILRHDIQRIQKFTNALKST